MSFLPEGTVSGYFASAWEDVAIADRRCKKAAVSSVLRPIPDESDSEAEPFAGENKRGTAIRRRVQWRPMDSAFYIGTETVAESQFDIDDLERRKDYVVRIAELSGQAEQSYRVAYFTTAAQSGRYAGMALQSKYAVGAPVLLKAINVSDRGAVELGGRRRGDYRERRAACGRRTMKSSYA